MAELGFTGNIRYLAVPAGLLAVLGGIGVGWLVDVGRRRARRLAAGGAAAARPARRSRSSPARLERAAG